MRSYWDVPFEILKLRFETYFKKNFDPLIPSVPLKYCKEIDSFSNFLDKKKTFCGCTLRNSKETVSSEFSKAFIDFLVLVFGKKIYIFPYLLCQIKEYIILYIFLSNTFQIYLSNIFPKCVSY